jgi:hypothetical protein
MPCAECADRIDATRHLIVDNFEPRIGVAGS